VKGREVKKGEKKEGVVERRGNGCFVGFEGWTPVMSSGCLSLRWMLTLMADRCARMHDDVTVKTRHSSHVYWEN